MYIPKTFLNIRRENYHDIPLAIVASGPKIKYSHNLHLPPAGGRRKKDSGKFLRGHTNQRSRANRQIKRQRSKEYLMF